MGVFSLDSFFFTAPLSQTKHIGNFISNTMDGNQVDVRVKAAKYIDKNNSICQSAHPQTKVKLKNIFNCHYTGCQLWQIGSRALVKLESTYNRSLKVMLELPWDTHRYLMMPLSAGLPHLHKVLVKGYPSFIQMIRNSAGQ